MKITTIRAVVVVGSAIAIFCFVSAKIKADWRVEQSALARNGPPAVTYPAGANEPLAVSDDDKGFWLTIRPTGFEPSEITVPAGEYFVVIHNATGLNQFAFRVERESGEQLLSVRLPFRRRYWKNTIHLRPGRFIISEADHPEWSCRITVTAE